MDSRQDKNIIDLAEEISIAESSVLNEEQGYLDATLGIISEEISLIKNDIPYPDVEKYSVGMDYDDIADIQWKKGKNKPYWDRLDVVLPYDKEDPLYIGHLQIRGTEYTDFYIMRGNLETKPIGNNALLLGYFDKRYQDIRRLWNFPKDDKSGSIIFSRGVTIKRKKVESVDIKLDVSSELLSKISDNYLRKVLIRNKTQAGITSIIQSIQRKQDDIMTESPRLSFIVQGCAGAGKTMVLLHRLQYLLYNKMLFGEQYNILVPSESFKKFIYGAARDFGIYVDGIYTYKQFYQFLTSGNKKQPVDTYDESGFPQNFLKRVYSESLVRECYSHLSDIVVAKAEALIDFCEAKLSYLAEQAIRELQESNVEIEEQYLQEVSEAVSSIAPLLHSFNVDKISPDSVIEETKALLSSAIQQYNAEKLKIANMNFTFSEEEVESADESLAKLRQELDEAKAKAAKSNIFTSFFRYRKVSQLRELYDGRYKKVEDTLVAKQKEKLLDETPALLENGVSIETCKIIVRELERVRQKHDEILSYNKEQIENADEYVRRKYSDEGEELIGFVKYLDVFREKLNSCVSRLETCRDIFREFFKKANFLFHVYTNLSIPQYEKGARKELDALKIFTHQNASELYGYFQLVLMTKCKTIINDEFGLILSEVYKHYSYLSLYFSYLVKGSSLSSAKYIFMDEAQDLSSSEHALIYKMNNQPVMNLFGDINQVISSQGVDEWSSLPFIKDIRILDENFRNTNQIIEYCNIKLPSKFEMKKIGVDMENVSEYDSLDDFIKQKRALDNVCLIVKDETTKDDTLIYLQKRGINFTNIYTVKAAKGLEFYSVVVIDRDMTNNEKYIAYTRALSKLTVIKNCPHFIESEKVRIVQGERNTTNEEAGML